MGKTKDAGSSPLTRGKRIDAASAENVSRLIPAHAGKTRPRTVRVCGSRAHPRSRGENVDGQRETAEEWGSSPLTRGKQHVRRIDCKAPGLIPAHAGKTVLGAVTGTINGAHPRSRGENRSLPAFRRSRDGSSPLTRGKHETGRTALEILGLIPAHAGKTFKGMGQSIAQEGSSPLTRGKPSRRRCRRWRAGAHPRSRGENLKKVPATCSPRGSSPLTRGKPHCGDPRGMGLGLIPAHAGKTIRTLSANPKPRAHPRSRGENGVDMTQAIGRLGSSPLTRGKRVSPVQERAGDGLIPAHAGKTGRRPASRPRYGAHPRSRGENGCCGRGSRLDRGSSPLTRGKRRFRGLRVPRGGLIPAHAGKTPLVHASRFHRWAHPRSRGENLNLGVECIEIGGSSPLTRGKRLLRSRISPRPGLIPAHAGKTTSARPEYAPIRAHPRSRGENGTTLGKTDARLGSSPLTRGKHGVEGGVSGREGLIPAHAGKTSRPRSALSPAWAHPRSRGENRYTRARWLWRLGSSPLTRGKHVGGRDARCAAGLIPAHAGKTH